MRALLADGDLVAVVEPGPGDAVRTLRVFGVSTMGSPTEKTRFAG
jgi:hypothetical protein